MAKRQFITAVTVSRTSNGFIVRPTRDDMGYTTDSYVANDYAHLGAIVRELLGPVDLFPDDIDSEVAF